MMHGMKTLIGAAALVSLSGPSTAQAQDWSYMASVYLFAPETKTGIGGTESTLSFKDALDNLDVSFMGAFEARNGRWGLLADYMLNDVSFGNSVSNPPVNTVNTSTKTQMFNGYALYRVYDEQAVKVDLAGGFRWFSTKTALTLTPGLLPGSSATVEESWVDPVIGARVRFDIADNWSGTAFFDYGGFSSDSETWQTLLTIDYALNDRWLLRGGYRYISVDHDINGTDFKFSQSGPIFGATYRF